MIDNQLSSNNIKFKEKRTNTDTETIMSSPEKLLNCVGYMLTKLVQEAPLPTNKDSKFYCKTKPAISICDYLKSRFSIIKEYIVLPVALNIYF